METAKTPLAPFKDASGQRYWTSEGVRSTKTFNYAYPETQRWGFSSDDDYARSVMRAVQQLYGGVSRQFGADRGLNLIATSSSLPPARVLQQKQAVPPSPIVEASGSAQAPVAAHAAKSESHPFRDFVAKLKGKSDQTADRTRELDLEAEIGTGLSLAALFHSQRTAF